MTFEDGTATQLCIKKVLVYYEKQKKLEKS